MKLNLIKVFNHLIVLIIAVSVFQCFKLTKDFPEKKSYLIEVESPKPSNRNVSGVSLKLRRVTVSSKFEGKSFVYRKSNSNYESDFYNEFLVSPQSNLGEEIIHYLEKRKLFSSVSGMNSRMEATHYLEVDFDEIYGDFRDKDNSYAVLSATVRVFDDRLGDYKLINTKSYSVKIKVNPDIPDSLVGGWNQGLAKILFKISSDLERMKWD